MASYVAENRMSGFSPALTISELDAFLEGKKATWIDLRDVFSYEKAHVEGAINLPLEVLSSSMASLDPNSLILVYDQTGKKGHQALRTLVGAGFTNVINVSGGFISLSNYVRALAPVSFELKLSAPEAKTLGEEAEVATTEDQEVVVETTKEVSNEPIIIDVRTEEEFAYGAYPGAINIPLDELESQVDDLGRSDRQITLYCASGARSAYAVQILKAYGFTNLENGGGLARMMANLRRNA
jgi:rhodanese-related sulfurtransferase